MENRDRFSGAGRRALRGCTLVGLTLVILATQLTAVQAGPHRLPPLPLPPRPTPVQPVPGFTGEFIELFVRFPQAWPWKGTHWQNLWTVVQWQDDRGVWHDVEGWQGAPDEVVTGEDGMVVGHKTWWVANDDLGKGPFRWQIYRDKQGAPVGTSETFDLPSQRRVSTTVEVIPAQ
jgi:hypothetical protein